MNLPRKKDNIAEYLLYMWQLEDLIRAFGLDIDKIRQNIIEPDEKLSEPQKKELLDLYESLIDMMRREDVVKNGHLQINKNVILELDDLNRRLLADTRYAQYAAEYYNTLPLIVELRAKAGDNKKGEIETCFDALYGLLLLKLQKKEISEDTAKAAAQISRFIATLTQYYKKDENGELFKDED